MKSILCIKSNIKLNEMIWNKMNRQRMVCIIANEYPQNIWIDG